MDVEDSRFDKDTLKKASPCSAAPSRETWLRVGLKTNESGRRSAYAQTDLVNQATSGRMRGAGRDNHGPNLDIEVLRRSSLFVGYHRTLRAFVSSSLLSSCSGLPPN